MRRRILAAIFIGALAVTGAHTSTAAGSEVVELRVRGRYLSAPATVRMTIVVEPDEANRRLRIEMDGDLMFRASELTLDGANEKRVHEISFRDVPAGRYILRAAVLSAKAVRGTASENLEVIGLGSDGAPH